MTSSFAINNNITHVYCIYHQTGILLKKKSNSFQQNNNFEFIVLKPIDKIFFMFANSFTLLISDIICANPDSHDFQMKQRTQKYNDLKHAVQILRYAREDSPIGNVFLKMYLLESGQIKFEQYKVRFYHSLMQLDPWGILHC